MEQRCCLAIDLKSFYASVECAQRGLDPMGTHLVVADESRTDKTICLAVSPSLRAYGIPGRARLFEVRERVRQINRRRQLRAPGGQFTGSSCDVQALERNPALALDFLVAPPQMQHYMDTSAGIYQIYLQFVAPEDIHVYSIDEVFLELTHYRRTYSDTPRQLATRIMGEIYRRTGITATCGIGTNLYLCKVAMDILAKHAEPDEHGARIAQLDEMGYRTRLWDHQPLTDFWRVGPGYAKKLASVGLHTMGDIARCSLGRPDQYHNPALLYRLFGVNAELLIDHAWGWEPCTIRDIKSYVPQSASLSSGQVLFRPYGFEEALLIAREMADALSLQLVEKGLVTDQLVLTVGYDRENLTRQGDVPAVLDRYGRAVPRSAHGSIRPEEGFTSSTKALLRAVGDLFRRIVDPALTVRRLYLAANHVRPESARTSEPAQLSLFEGPDRAEQQARERERRQQQTVLALQKRFGKNAVVRGMNLQQASTARQRNEQVGGHRKG